MPSPPLHELIDSLNLTYHLENSSLGILLWNSDMRLIYCSAKARRIFGWVDYEKNWSHRIYANDLLHPDDAEQVKSTIEEVFSGRIPHNHSLNKNLTATGAVIFCQWYNSVLKNELGEVENLLSLVQDVTSEMQTNLSLQAHEQQLSLVFNSAIDPMWLITCETDGGFR